MWQRWKRDAIAMRFENPANGYVETVRLAPLWVLYLAPFYFWTHRAWFHVVVTGVLTFVIILPGVLWWPFAAGIVRRVYLRKGWRQVA